MNSVLWLLFIGVQKSEDFGDHAPSDNVGEITGDEVLNTPSNDAQAGSGEITQGPGGKLGITSAVVDSGGAAPNGEGGIEETEPPKEEPTDQQVVCIVAVDHSMY